MRNSNIQEIVFYGKDFTSIDEVTVCFTNKKGEHINKPISEFEPEQNEKAVKVKNDSSNNNNNNTDNVEPQNAAKELLWYFLNNINDLLGPYVVGHSEGKFNSKDKFQILWVNDKPKDNKDRRSFGPLVGTIRKIYSKNDIKNDMSKHIKTVLGKKEKQRLPNELAIKVVIYSRFDNLENDPEKTSPYFLASLLLKRTLKFNNLNVDFDYNDLFDFYMLFLLRKHFNDALLKGFFKKYQRFERNDDRLRGSIDIARHIRLNMGMANGKIAYSYRENSLDNMMNHLILTAYDYLEEKFPNLVAENFDSMLEQELRQLKYEIGYPKYDRRTVISKNNIPISHPFFTEYRQLQKDCLAILRDEGVSPFENKDECLDGVLYYVPDLWEEYLDDYIQRELLNRNRSGVSGFTIRSEAQKEILVMTDLKGKGGHKTEPDYVFSYQKNGQSSYSNDDAWEYFFILDAKYKYGWPEALKGELLSRNLEDYTKCLRDMNSISAIAAAVIFPVRKEELDKLGASEELQYIHRLSRYNEIASFYTFPIVVPDAANNIHQWDMQMNKNIGITMTILMNSLENEAKRQKILRDVMKQFWNKVEESNIRLIDISKAILNKSSPNHDNNG